MQPQYPTLKTFLAVAGWALLAFGLFVIAAGLGLLPNGRGFDAQAFAAGLVVVMGGLAFLAASALIDLLAAQLVALQRLADRPEPAPATPAAEGLSRSEQQLAAIRDGKAP